MTYSIVARDPDTEQMGVAVQSHWFSVGSIVTWAEAGVGVVATQAFADPSYGPRGLDLMRSELSGVDAVAALTSVDEASSRRQVAMVDASGRVGVHTGDACIAEAGHVTGDGFSCQANMMLRDTVPDAMATAFTAQPGDLVDRLVAALDAAEGQGGDIRGRQSAALLVVGGERGTGTELELRVEDHPEPLDELRRLVRVQRAYELMNRGDELVASGDVDAAAALYEEAQQAAPQNPEFTFWRAMMHARRQEFDEAKRLLAEVEGGPGAWRELARRLPGAGLLPEEVVAKMD